MVHVVAHGCLDRLPGHAGAAQGMYVLVGLMRNLSYEIRDCSHITSSSEGGGGGEAECLEKVIEKIGDTLVHYEAAVLNEKNT